MSEWNRHLAPSIFSVVENMTLGHKKWTEECTDTAAPRIHRVQQGSYRKGCIMRKEDRCTADALHSPHNTSTRKQDNVFVFSVVSFGDCRL
ncbi:hypothetical protein J6590_002115 [Homalodisca vitripennis]|nr:hypothetical protein J6590_002115 [Homalodisca vitripennis]